MHFLKKSKYIFIILFFICTFFTIQKAYAYNLKFEVKYIEETEGKREARFTVSANKSPKSQQEYTSAYKKDGVWVYNEGNEKSLFGAKNTPTTGNYIMKQLTFAKMENVYTNYANSGTNSLAVSYLVNDNIIPYQDGSYIFSSGKEQGTVALSGNLGFSGAYFLNTDLAELRYKIQGDLNISEYKLVEMDFIMLKNYMKDGMVRVSSNNYTLKSDYSGTGLVSSTHNNMYAAWQYYGVTQPASGGSSWLPYTRGCGPNSSRSNCADSGTYAKNSSINSYDNILVLPVAGKPRKVYVRYVDENGVVIGGVANETSADGKKAISPIPEASLPSGATQNDINEYYEIGFDDTIKLDRYQIPGYDYLGYKQLVSLNLNNAYNTMKNDRSYSGGSTYTFKTSKNKDYSFINFVYKKKKEEYPAKLTLQGVLNFINRKNNTSFDGAANNWFGPSTADKTSINSSYKATDYIASGFSLVPYISEAYPYVVRGLNYEYVEINPSSCYNRGISKDGLNGVYQTSLSVYSQFDYTYKYYSSETVREGGSTSCEDDGITSTYKSCDAPLDEKGKCTEEEVTYEVHRTICKREGPYEAREYGYYSVPYDFRYFRLNNFKIYAIEKAEAIDSDSNAGGLLFSDPKTYMISVSQEYKNRFSAGFAQNNKGITFSGSTQFDLGSVGDVGTTWDWGVVQAKINATNAKVAPYKNNQNDIASKNGASVALRNVYNDSVNLDGGDVLVKNVKGDPTNRGPFQLTDSRFWNDGNSPSAIKKSPYEDTKIYMVENANDYVGYLSNLQNYITPPPAKQTTINDWNKQDIDIIKQRTNGARLLTGKLYYKLLEVDGFDYGSGDFNVDNHSPSTSYGSFLDSRFRGITVNGNKADVSNPNVLSVLPVEHVISGDSNVDKVNVLTPLNIQQIPELQISDKIVDHSMGNTSIPFSQLQRNSWFTIAPSPTSYSEVKYVSVPTLQFVKKYYFVFNFDIAEAQGVVGDTAKKATIYGNRLVEVEANGQPATLKAKTTNDYGDPTVQQIQNQYRVFATAYNIPSNIESQIRSLILGDPFSTTNISFMDTKYNEPYTGGARQGGPNDDAYHAIATDPGTTSNLARIFDFRVTDCTDVNFKDIFRTTSGADVNKHTEQFYYSGTRTWLRSTVNTTVSTNTIKYLPVGPYKQEQYISAPKLGYRFSFDLKTSGYLNDSTNYGRKVEIKPSYYFISKDGTVFKDKISLYYKNSSGKYVPLSGYKIYFTPNDGYRYVDTKTQTPLRDINLDTMSKKLESYSITQPFTLDNRFMATSNAKYYQTWFGEYKLPNSTIAYESSTGGNIDLSKPLTNGYIGVKFEITVTDYNPDGSVVSKLSYNTGDKDTIQGEETNAPVAPNTTQWDYEGYMGFAKPGTQVNAGNSVTVQLEKGKWIIKDQTMYDTVKGTVILYDADNRAANDFE